VANLSSAVASGDRRETLKALRRMLAERIAARPRPRDLAALSLQLMQIMKEVEALEGSRPRRAPRR
jgi:hypothetical protein